MAGAPASSSVLARSVINSLASESYRQSQEQPTANKDISALPFILNSIERTWNSFLHFAPGAFNRRGTLLGGGATFSVERHSLNEKRGSLMVDPFSGANECLRPEFVAVKKVRQISASPDYVFKSIERDLMVLHRLKGCKNILKMLGVGWEPSPVRGDSRLWPVLVSEIADMGSLDSVQRKVGSLHYHTKRKFCLDVAHGLSALHQDRMTHGDVKTENVLIFSDTNEGYIAKLSDFAFSSTVAQLRVNGKTPPVLDDDHEFSVVGATALWAPPEFRSQGSFNSFASRDVYSWALLVIRVMMDGKFPPGDLGLGDGDESDGSCEDLCLGNRRVPSFPPSPKATLERRQHTTIGRDIPILRKYDKRKADPSNIGNAPLESELPQSSIEGLRVLKIGGMGGLITYCIKLIRRSGQSDVKADVTRLRRVLAACLDVDPKKRSLDAAVRAWG